MTSPDRTAWRTVLEAQSALMRLYESEMQASSGISLAWYDVLIHLSEARDGTMRMSELASALLLSRSWLTRRIDGMEAAGLVERCRASDDGRGVCARLTGEGRTMCRKATLIHVGSIRRHFLAYLEPGQIETIDQCFARIEAHARISLNRKGTLRPA
ncbi:MAG: MarR family winged helix-turn-helix transcriptional regulator, partial [Actinomycetota bacterium]|nr:MarR family winged helix-turn-helix transcriptional regulator [Actinomycetota bacterium]